MRSPSCLCVSPTPNFFVLYAVRVVSKERRYIVLPSTSCIIFWSTLRSIIYALQDWRPIFPSFAQRNPVYFVLLYLINIIHKWQIQSMKLFTMGLYSSLSFS
jgi:hypothetical protein